MANLQLMRTPSGRHPYMSRWSRNEPASCTEYIGNNDHWSKLKHRAAILTLKYEDGDTGVAFWTDNEPYENEEGEISLKNWPIRFPANWETFKQSLHESRSRSQLLRREHQRNNKRLPSIGSKTFTETMIQSLNGEKPGHYTLYKYSNKNVLRSSANDRARKGFRYWVLDKPVPKGGKYTTGARTSVLGLGKSFFP